MSSFSLVFITPLNPSTDERSHPSKPTLLASYHSASAAQWAATQLCDLSSAFFSRAGSDNGPSRSQVRAGSTWLRQDTEQGPALAGPYVGRQCPCRRWAYRSNG